MDGRVNVQSMNHEHATTELTPPQKKPMSEMWLKPADLKEAHIKKSQFFQFQFKKSLMKSPNSLVP